MMRGKIASGRQMGAGCLRTEIGLRKYIGKRCLNEMGQARQGFDACRAVSLVGYKLVAFRSIEMLPALL